MPLNALTLSVTTGLAGQRFKSKINGLTAGTAVEVQPLNGGGFGELNGFLVNSQLPTEPGAVRLIERNLASGEKRTTDVAITAVRYAGAVATAVAELPGGRTLRKAGAAPSVQGDGSIAWGIVTEDDLGTSRTSGATGGGGGSVTPPPDEAGSASTLPAPGLIRTSPVMTNPPTFDVDLGNPAFQAGVGQTLHLEYAADFAFTSNVGHATAAITSTTGPFGPFDFGSGYTKPNPGFARIRARKVGETWGPWSPIRAWGDNVAPTIASSASVSNAENSVLAHNLTASEGVTWAIQGGADQDKFELNGAVLRWVGNGTKDFEAPNDADTNNTYLVTARATDYAGNFTDQAITVTVTDVAEVTPTTWSPTNKATGIALTNGNLTATSTNDGNADCVATNTSKTGGKHEIGLGVNWNGLTGGDKSVGFGLCQASLNLAVANGSFPGFVGANSAVGIVVYHNGGNGADVYQNGAYTGVSFTLSDGQNCRAAVDLDAKRLWFKVNGVAAFGNPAAGTGGIDISGWATGAVRFWCGFNNNFLLTLTPQPSGLSTGFSRWDDF